ncbi:ImmA/IrrE family metallo-endopeptidase [Sphingobacterium sp. UT-1RO-CII-1]|uniref:ImmA/IrrE family metallo-endopeptidase n=1 Tax=Sphingobacterium sp. UT-1RO-CII-1 TaxID=2995225 RepID=UPI00227A4C38|nr:ImmA/IrrE family metallo-endopeptidase [Sphingobacterium sp. UT-1RO-CII-1]MCY4779269.1 ImmA/IrrE family metallo-endopeptidase [Sphingobacterium sp. UT-1RO-CII-1]
MKNIDIDKLLEEIFNDDVSLDLKARFEEKIVEYGVTKTKALKLLNVDKDVFEDIINGTAKQPNLIHVVKIAEFLEINVDDFIQMVLKNQNIENITSIDRARKVRFLMKNFDVKALTKLGFFDNTDDIDELVERILHYFGYDSIRHFEEELVTPLYSRTKRKFSDKMKDFWVRSAYQTFRLIDNENEYDRERLKDVLVNMKPYSQDVRNGLYTVCRALYNVGVTVIFQNYLTTTHVRGATFIINNKPCIVLTDNQKKYPTIWFTLLHELHHVLFDYDAIKTNSYHLSDDEDLFLIEEKANSFARDYFMPRTSFDYIKTYIKNDYMVEQFAKENEIHKSLVYSFYTWYQQELYNKNYYAAFKEHYPDYKPAIAKLNPITWDEDTVREASEKIKAVFEIN